MNHIRIQLAGQRIKRRHVVRTCRRDLAGPIKIGMIRQPDPGGSRGLLHVYLDAAVTGQIDRCGVLDHFLEEPVRGDKREYPGRLFRPPQGAARTPPPGPSRPPHPGQRQLTAGQLPYITSDVLT